MVGCGALLPLGGEIAEVRRMFVEPAARQRGVGRKILAVLETMARDLGYDTLPLGTGLRQPAALRLYESAGFHPVAAYGRYRDEPMSVCFEKLIAR